jgi:hypothetical protein
MNKADKAVEVLLVVVIVGSLSLFGLVQISNAPAARVAPAAAGQFDRGHERMLSVMRASSQGHLVERLLARRPATR